MRFGQLIECNMMKFFLKYHTQNVVVKLFPVPFLKSLNWPFLCINKVKFYSVCFNCPSREITKYLETKVYITFFFFTSYKVSLKHKTRFGIDLPASYFVWFLKRLSHVTLYSLNKLHCLIAFTSWHIIEYVYGNYLFPRFWRHNFWN